MSEGSAPPEKEVVVSGGAGLSAAVASEVGLGLGELESVRARGYWELVWIRFRRDRLALASGVFIICLFIVAFAGAPIAAHFIGHGPNDIFGTETGAVDATSLLPANPMTHISYLAPPTYTHTNHDILVLGAANRLGQD